MKPPVSSRTDPTVATNRAGMARLPGGKRILPADGHQPVTGRDKDLGENVAMTSALCFPEPITPDLRYDRYADTSDQVGWLDRSTLPGARRIREFLNRSLAELGPVAGERLCHRLRQDPPFGRVFFELVVGRFLQALSAELEDQPAGADERNVDWRATFPSGVTVYVEATSPAYNQPAYRERLRRERLLGAIEQATPPGWWVIARDLPKIGLHESRREFRRVVESLMTDLPTNRAGISFENRLRLAGQTARGRVALELWPGDPHGTPIGMVSMGGYVDDSELRVARAVRDKRHQARAFPGAPVILAIDAPWGGPDTEQFDTALLGHSVMHLGLDYKPSHYSFRRDGALARQRSAEFAAVLAFQRVGVFGGPDPVLYHHPRYVDPLPAELVILRRRFLEDEGIGNLEATRTGIMDSLGFPSANEGRESED